MSVLNSITLVSSIGAGVGLVGSTDGSRRVVGSASWAVPAPSLDELAGSEASCSVGLGNGSVAVITGDASASVGVLTVGEGRGGVGSDEQAINRAATAQVRAMLSFTEISPREPEARIIAGGMVPGKTGHHQGGEIIQT